MTKTGSMGRDCYDRGTALQRRRMSTLRWLVAAAALSLAACQAATSNDQQGNATASAEQGAGDKLARVEMRADTSYLTDEERQVVNLLIQAADLMNPIYLRQVSHD